MRAVSICAYCGGPVARTESSKKESSAHSDLRSCIGHLAKKIREADGHISDLVEFTGLGETDDPVQNGWVGSDGRP